MLNWIRMWEMRWAVQSANFY